jgi:MarR family transcriptional regulator for hemolysin
MEQQNPPLLGKIVGQMMTEMFRVLKKRISEGSDLKITAEQFGLLNSIYTSKEDVIQQDMANFMGKDKSTILRLIDSLEEKGLLRRVADTTDRRKNFLMITKKGNAVISEYLKIEFKLNEDLLEGLSQAEIDLFCKIVSHIQNRAHKM